MNKDPRIQALMEGKNLLLVKNSSLSVKDIEIMTNQWKTSKRVAPIAASFSAISDLKEEHIRHFRSAPYIFKPISGTLFGGILLDDNLDYVHLVLMTEEVLVYILDLK